MPAFPQAEKGTPPHITLSARRSPHTFAMRALVLLILMFALQCVARDAQAQIHRCIGAQGEPVFTDQPCGSTELAIGVPSHQSDQGDRIASGAMPGETGARIAATCPHSPEEVRQRIAVAFNENSPNALAGLFDWRGFSHAGADSRLKDFSRWLKQPLVGVHFSGAADPSGAQPDDLDYSPTAPSGLTVLTQPRGDGSPDARSFGMGQLGGCWWLSF